MKIKQIIFIYIFAFWVTLFGSGIDPDLEAAINASLLDQNQDSIITEQNLAYELSRLEYEQNSLRETLTEQTFIVCYNWNKKIKQTREENNLHELENIKETIKNIMKLIPHEALENEQINELTYFTSFWNTIQREKSKIADVLENREEKIEENNILKKVINAREVIKIYNKALIIFNTYMQENNIKKNKIITEKEKLKQKNEEYERLRKEEYERLRKEEFEKKNKKQKEKEALKQEEQFKEEEEERNRIKRENDPQLKEIKNIREKMYKKVSDYLQKKEFETKLKEAKEKNDEDPINDIQKNIELIMKYCPHEFFSEENIQHSFFEIKKTWMDAQREHSPTSKIVNPTEKNDENLEDWKNELKNLERYIFFENLSLRLGVTRIKLKAEKTKKNHFKIGAGIGLFTGFGLLLANNNFFNKSSKKTHFPQKALTILGLTISGGIGGNYFYRIKKYLPQKLEKNKSNKIDEKQLF